MFSRSSKISSADMGLLRSVGSIKLEVYFGSFVKETYNFIDPIIRSHPIGGHGLRQRFAVLLD